MGDPGKMFPLIPFFFHSHKFHKSLIPPCIVERWFVGEASCLPILCNIEKQDQYIQYKKEIKGVQTRTACTVTQLSEEEVSPACSPCWDRNVPWSMTVLIDYWVKTNLYFGIVTHFASQLDF